MKNFFSALFWFLILALLALFFNYFLGEKFCGVCQNGGTKMQQEQVKPLVDTHHQKLAEFMITDPDGNTLFKFPSSFIINAKNGNIKIPESMMSFKDSIYAFLNRNQDKELLISAKYLKSEGEPKGLDRANFLKNILTKMGVNPHRIIPKAVLSDYNYDTASEYGNGIAMLFKNIPEEDLKAIEESITNKTLYSNFGAKEFKPDGTLRAYSYELKNYLAKHPDKHASVTGHTDNVGNADANYALGLKRAKNVMTYLVGQGVNAKHIKASSKGETAPVASNDTEEGRAKNRRITIIVK